jgi:hypothetical protein
LHKSQKIMAIEKKDIRKKERNEEGKLEKISKKET